MTAPVVKHKKTALSMIVTIALIVLEQFYTNADVFGLNTKDLTIISMVITIVSVIWNDFVDEEKDILQKIMRRPKA